MEALVIAIFAPVFIGAMFCVFIVLFASLTASLILAPIQEASQKAKDNEY